MRTISTTTSLYMDSNDMVDVQGISTGLFLGRGGNNSIFVTGTNDSITPNQTGMETVYDFGKGLNIIADLTMGPITIYGMGMDATARITVDSQFQTATVTPYSDRFEWGTKVALSPGPGGGTSGTIYVPYDHHVSVVST